MVITGHVPEGDIVPEGVPVTFTAVTEPPGYEEDITWLATTKYGTGVPILGRGPTFTTQFDNTFGPHPDGGLWQWLGVKADNAAAGQDQKTLEIDVIHTGTINGDDFVAIGTGTANPDTGVVIVDWTLDDLVTDYDTLCSIVTLTSVTGGSTVACQNDEAVNLLTLSGGNYSAVITSPGITTTMTVSTSENVINASYESNGDFVCTGITSILPGTYNWVPGRPESNQFSERMYVMMENESGEIEAVRKDIIYTLPNGIDLPSAQERDVAITVLSESPDGLNVTIRYDVCVFLAGERDRCRYELTAATPLGGPPPCSPGCPCLPVNFFCGIACPPGNCNLLPAWQGKAACGMSGTCLEQWSLVGCEVCLDTCP